MGSSGMGHSVPIAAVIDGTAFNENNEEVPIVEEIDYQEFFEVSSIEQWPEMRQACQRNYWYYKYFQQYFSNFSFLIFMCNTVHIFIFIILSPTFGGFFL